MTQFFKHLDGYTFIAPSRVKNKKYDAYKDGRYITSFGALSYQHYHDKIGYYSRLNHGDSERKRRYFLRHGKEAKKDSSKYFSHTFLWS